MPSPRTGVPRTPLSGPQDEPGSESPLSMFSVAPCDLQALPGFAANPDFRRLCELQNLQLLQEEQRAKTLETIRHLDWEQGQLKPVGDGCAGTRSHLQAIEKWRGQLLATQRQQLEQMIQLHRQQQDLVTRLLENSHRDSRRAAAPAHDGASVSSDRAGVMSPVAAVARSAESQPAPVASPRSPFSNTLGSIDLRGSMRALPVAAGTPPHGPRAPSPVQTQTGGAASPRATVCFVSPSNSNVGQTPAPPSGVMPLQPLPPQSMLPSFAGLGQFTSPIAVGAAHMASGSWHLPPMMVYQAVPCSMAPPPQSSVSQSAAPAASSATGSEVPAAPPAAGAEEDAAEGAQPRDASTAPPALALSPGSPRLPEAFPVRGTPLSEAATAPPGTVDSMDLDRPSTHSVSLQSRRCSAGMARLRRVQSMQCVDSAGVDPSSPLNQTTPPTRRRLMREDSTTEVARRGSQSRGLARTVSHGSPRRQSSVGLRWKKGAEVGKGAFGTVHIALNEETGEMMAVKSITLTNDKKNIQQRLQQLRAEIDMMKRLHHNNIVEYRGTERGDGNTLHIFMEYVAGGSIASLIEQFGALTEEVTVNYTGQVLEGLEYLHSHGAVHRDIKGANLLLTTDGVCKLADFGAATYIRERENTEALVSVCGTPNWMAPEVITQNGHTFSADIWSLGCTVMEMLTGKVPWSHISESPMQVLHFIASDRDVEPGIIAEFRSAGLSEHAHQFVLECLKRDPGKRPTVQEFLGDAEPREDDKQHNPHPWLLYAAELAESDGAEEDAEHSERHSPRTHHLQWLESVQRQRQMLKASLGITLPETPLVSSLSFSAHAPPSRQKPEAPQSPPTRTSQESPPSFSPTSDERADKGPPPASRQAAEEGADTQPDPPPLSPPISPSSAQSPPHCPRKASGAGPAPLLRITPEEPTLLAAPDRLTLRGRAHTANQLNRGRMPHFRASPQSPPRQARHAPPSTALSAAPLLREQPSSDGGERQGDGPSDTSAAAGAAAAVAAAVAAAAIGATAAAASGSSCRAPVTPILPPRHSGSAGRDQGAGAGGATSAGSILSPPSTPASTASPSGSRGSKRAAMRMRNDLVLDLHGQGKPCPSTPPGGPTLQNLLGAALSPGMDKECISSPSSQPSMQTQPMATQESPVPKEVLDAPSPQVPQVRVSPPVQAACGAPRDRLGERDQGEGGQLLLAPTPGSSSAQQGRRGSELPCDVLTVSGSSNPRGSLNTPHYLGSESSVFPLSPSSAPVPAPAGMRNMSQSARSSGGGSSCPPEVRGRTLREDPKIELKRYRFPAPHGPPPLEPRRYSASTDCMSMSVSVLTPPASGHTMRTPAERDAWAHSPTRVPPAASFPAPPAAVPIGKDPPAAQDGARGGGRPSPTNEGQTD